MKLSVILPLYNCEEFVERAIKSVIDQSYTDWELIIVNDGSTDKSEAIADVLAQGDERIIIITQNNKGVSAARNRGMQEMSGDILLFLDADDWFEKNAFETVIDNWSDYSQMILFDYYDVTDEGKKSNKKHFASNRLVFGKGSECSIDDLELTVSGFNSRQKYTKTIIEAPWGKAFSAKYIKNNGLVFPEDLFMSEDQVFNLSAIIGMDKVTYISTPIYNYFLNPSSITSAVYKPESSCELLISNFSKVNCYLRDLFLPKGLKTYEDAYYYYVFTIIKIVVWWLSGIKEQERKVLGRQFVYSHALEIKNHWYAHYSFTDRIILFLCKRKLFNVLESVVGARRYVKFCLRIR